MPDEKKWTLMFYLASDNPLAPGVISQLKAIKAAGWHQQANVIVQFDPYTEDTPTHVFDVNISRKKSEPDKVSDIGFRANDSYVHNLIEDRLWRDETDRHGNLIRERLGRSLDYNHELLPNGGTGENGNHQEPSPQESLGKFLQFCADSYPADHYMLFIMGHGVVVGNDVFLFDEHAEEQTLSLGGLRDVLNEFHKSKKKGALELVSFHSCSVSSLEVAYELRGMANYMLASQAPTYIGSLPYRQILVRIFNSLEPNKEANTIELMLRDICAYCFHNSKDFLLAGYPYDICLSRLGQPVDESKAEIDKLAAALKKGLGVASFKDAILLAHLKAQSFQSEMYLDIADFCRCLYRQILRASAATEDEDSIRTEIKTACEKVISAVRNNIVRSRLAGPEYQYAKGFSIYFPWSRPSDYLMSRYGDHDFVKPREGSWLDFLDKYFSATMRKGVQDEALEPIAELGERSVNKQPNPGDELWEDKVALVYTQAAGQASPYALDRPIKTDSTDPMGTCSCSSIKNYPRDTRRRKERKKAPDKFPASLSSE